MQTQTMLVTVGVVLSKKLSWRLHHSCKGIIVRPEKKMLSVRSVVKMRMREAHLGEVKFRGREILLYGGG